MHRLFRLGVALGVFGLVLAASVETALAERLDPAQAAAHAGSLLAKETAASPGNAATPAGRADDETFLKRVSLDIIGELPTPEEVTAFVLDPQADKRVRLVDRLLTSKQFGQNWGRYWRDVIMFRRTEDRALLAAGTLEDYLTEALNKDTPWDEIARSFITATGDIREKGETALIMAQMGETAETTAEVARIFLGIQIQCAKCHDHPTDRWKRKQFHELAAFFPRLEIRPVRSAAQRSFEVVSVDSTPRFRPPNQRRGTLEHYMPDLQDPTAEGTLMQPKFFVTGHVVDAGKADLDRRQALANLITGPSNPWFARAYVNRIWAEMVGEGFYEPIDDMGPDRQCSAPETLAFLADQFRANRHDVKWLFRTIAATEVYGLASRSRRTSEGTPFAANCAQRMRADQLFNALTTALGVPSLDSAGGQRRGGGGAGRFGGVRFLFGQAFGYDPSEPRDEIAGSRIPRCGRTSTRPATWRCWSTHPLPACGPLRTSWRRRLDRPVRTRLA